VLDRPPKRDAGSHPGYKSFHQTDRAKTMDGMLITIVGLMAAALTSLSYIPQVRKALPPGSTDDLSSKTLAVWAAGLALWIGYGFLKGDYVIIVANAVGFALIATLIGFKVRDSS